eukprot:TRINITY_DN10655_c0_g1_i1.p1 TRINITY_DN10655_c0_g1~~TRINITY_DN10655_c0_g1_i1.p1  ORF type:complete len:469 (-),score=92.30 TRINITY_DN10655_c0_g1_i1:297-1703(-)
MPHPMNGCDARRHSADDHDILIDLTLQTLSLDARFEGGDRQEEPLAPPTIPKLPSLMGGMGGARSSRPPRLPTKTPDAGLKAEQQLYLRPRPGSRCHCLRYVVVDRLVEDGTLGLLMHGTSIVGFCAVDAEDMGWQRGDQVVEVNRTAVSSFDEFLEAFIAARQGGFPIRFGVLRQEPVTLELASSLGDFNTRDITMLSMLGADVDAAGGSIPDSIREKLEGNNLTPLSEALGVLPDLAVSPDVGLSLGEPLEGYESNPYIEALLQRRTELEVDSEGWTACADTSRAASLPSRLATERRDALASLVKQAVAQDPPKAPPSVPRLPDLQSWSLSCREVRCRERACQYNGSGVICNGVGVDNYEFDVDDDTRLLNSPLVSSERVLTGRVFAVAQPVLVDRFSAQPADPKEIVASLAAREDPPPPKPPGLRAVSSEPEEEEEDCWEHLSHRSQDDTPCSGLSSSTMSTASR